MTQSAPEDGEQALQDALAASDAANAFLRRAVSAKRKRDEEGSEERRRASAELRAEAEQVRAEAEEAAAKLKEAAATEVADIRRVVRAERAALDAEKAARRARTRSGTTGSFSTSGGCGSKRRCKP